MLDDMVMSKSAEALPTAEAPAAADLTSPASTSGNSFGAFSETNVQVAGVDEPEIVKTDGKYVYFYNDKDHKVYIALAAPAKDMKIIKAITVPQNWYGAQIYIQ